MADEKASPDAPQQSPQDGQTEPRKRAAPTIDLTATEVPSDAATDEKPEPDAAPPRGGVMRRVGAGIGIGAALVVLLMFGLWRGGYLPIGAAADSGLKDKVAALEKQVSELQSRPQPQPDTGAVDALAKRVDKIEAALKNLPAEPAGVSDKLSAADNAMKSLGTALAALSHRTDDAAGNAADAKRAADAATKAVAELKSSVQAAAANNANSVPRADIEALAKRVGALETRAKATRETTNDSAARLALSASVLRNAVAVGAPYADELAEVRALGGDNDALAALEPFAASGVPTARTLGNELSALLPQILKIAGATPASADFLAKLEANASKLVRIRPLKAPRGDEPSAVLARLDVAAGNADIPAALADLAKLPDKERAPAEGWIAKAKARQAAIAAAAQYAAATTRALRPK